MTTLVSALAGTPRLLHRLVRYWSDFATGIDEARAMASLYRDLASMSEAQLAALGLKREDIPRTVVTRFQRA